jgi:TonB family protein
MNSFYSFLSHTIQYPVHARDRNIQGVVLLAFVVEKDGSLTDLKITNSPNEE